MLNMLHAGRDESLCGSTSNAIELRRAYFADAGEVALRYDVSFDELMDHLRAARAHHEHVTVSAIRHIEDLVQVVACVDGCDLAWRDLVDNHERALVRGGRQWMEPTDAIIFVRRLITDLRRDDGGGGGVRSLRSFDGTVPLRRWLADRMLGRMSLAGFAFTAAEPRPLAAH